MHSRRRRQWPRVRYRERSDGALSSPLCGEQRLERLAHELLQLGAARLRLVERGGEDSALFGKQALRVQHIACLGAAGIELLLADAEIFLCLSDRDLRGIERGEALGG